MNKLTLQEERVCQSVMGHIAQKRIQTARARAGLYGFFLIAAVVALIPSIQYIAAQAAASGFNEYVSLIMSDGSSLSGSWGPLALSIVDSIPLLGVIAMLFALTASAFCAKKFMGNFGNNFGNGTSAGRLAHSPLY
ncbi:MAG: hypothetical protein JWO00_202 [Candidatus Parcubacteria bacterium]|nr:hypothetical protein [Candidatus Parcubacteria bacterium]